jgi:hypothetical protein
MIGLSIRPGNIAYATKLNLWSNGSPQLATLSEARSSVAQRYWSGTISKLILVVIEEDCSENFSEWQKFSIKGRRMR